jgi:hypothetical protein
MSNRAVSFPSPACRGGLGRGLLQHVSAGEVAPSLTVPRKRGRGKLRPASRELMRLSSNEA